MIAQTLFLGENLLPLLTLAFGGALLVGNVLALVRPPENLDDADLERPPVLRTLLYAGIGAIMTLWALATLL